MVEGAHAELLRLAHDRLDLVEFALQQLVRDDRRVEQDFHGGLAALAVDGAHQTLRDDGAQVTGEVHQHLLATLFGKEVHDAIERLVGAVRMQRAQTQMAGLGEGDGVLHRLRVTDLTDQDHVRRLTQRVLERVVPRVRVDADFAVSDQRLLRLVHELDGIFHRHDVTGGGLVAMVDHRGERGRLARTRGTDHEHESALAHRRSR